MTACGAVIECKYGTDGTDVTQPTVVPPMCWCTACLAVPRAVHVEYKNEEDSLYEAVCDVSESVSCSKVGSP